MATSRLSTLDASEGEWISLAPRMPSMTREEARRLLQRPAANQLIILANAPLGIY